MNFLKRYYWIFLSISLIILDQVVKLIIDKTITENNSVVLIPGFFSLTHVRNPGAAFGILEDHPWVFMLFTTIILIAAVLVLCMGKIKNHWGIVALSLIIGGGAGNMIDRIFLGEVIDFFAFNFWGYQFAVFNVADIFVCCGTVILAFYIFFSHDFDGKKEKRKSGDGAS